MSQGATLHVGSNTPRLLEEGQAPPPPPNSDVPAEELEAPHVYWTPDKAQHVVAQICRAGSKFYGPSVKAAEWELELIGDPAAAVLNDWLPLRVGASSDKTANLIALAVVVAILVALRLPDILEVHGIIKPWKPKGQAEPEQQTTPVMQGPPANIPPPVVPAEQRETTDTFAPQLFGVNGNVEGDEQRREQVYGSMYVGQSGDIPGERR